MTHARHAVALAVLLTSLVSFQAGAQSDPAIDMGQSVPDAKAVSEGLFPEDACEQLKAAGFKCMGFKPAVRYSLPATAFKLGSAELPDTLKKQLEVFAEVLKTKKGPGNTVRIEGHADASGAAAAIGVASGDDGTSSSPSIRISTGSCPSSACSSRSSRTSAACW